MGFIFTIIGSMLLLDAIWWWTLARQTDNPFARALLGIFMCTQMLCLIGLVAFLALVALGASYLASYERAKGESLGYRGSEGLGYRSARLALLVLALLTGWIQGALWAFVILTVAASAVRGWNVARQERR